MMVPQRRIDRPYPNSYWVEPGRLLAGEYPGAETRDATRLRLRQLLERGIRTFIDLTREREMEPYAPEFEGLTADSVRHQRFAILDHSIPERPQVIVDALNAIDAALQRGEGVYVHCRAGIGRTGMVVATHLMRRGLDNERAFDHLQTLWQECGRARHWPVVPETDEQIEYVRRWQEPGRSAPVFRTRAEGALTGLVLADSIAAAVKAKTLDAQLDSNATLVLPEGPPTDSALTLAVLESFLTFGEHRPEDQLQRYLAWTRLAQHDAPMVIPDAFRRALGAWQWSRKPYSGSHDPANLCAHSVSRSLAVALCYPNEGERTVEMAADVSRTTQQSPIVLDVCRAFTAYALDALLGTPQDDVAAGRGPNVVALLQRMLRPEVREVLEGRASFRKRNVSAPAALHAALQTLATAPTFAAGVQRLAQIGAVHAAALFGALVGAARGIDTLPPAWRRSLPQQPFLSQICGRLTKS